MNVFKKVIFIGIILSFTSAFAAPNNSCLDSWKSAMKGNITSGEIAANTTVGFGALVATTVTIKASATVGTLAKIVATGGVVMSVALTANEQWDIIDQIFKQSLVKSGELLTEIGEAAKNSDVSIKKVIDNISTMDPADELTAKLLCTKSNQPVILGRYLELLFEVK